MPARLDPRLLWFDLAVALVPAATAAWSAMQLAPLHDLPARPVAALAALLILCAGLAVMRAASARRREFPIRVFRAPDDFAMDDPASESRPPETTLLLDRPIDSPMSELAELLLDDPLPAPSPDSRVVQLFPDQPFSSPAELKRRIDRHLGVAQPAVQGDAADSLRQALEDLRASLARH